MHNAGQIFLGICFAYLLFNPSLEGILRTNPSRTVARSLFCPANFAHPSGNFVQPFQ
jgi:hypothetical protein